MEMVCPATTNVQPRARGAHDRTCTGLNMFADAVLDLLDLRLRGGRGRLGAAAATSV